MCRAWRRSRENETCNVACVDDVIPDGVVQWKSNAGAGSGGPCCESASFQHPLGSTVDAWRGIFKIPRVPEYQIIIGAQEHVDPLKAVHKWCADEKSNICSFVLSGNSVEDVLVPTCGQSEVLYCRTQLFGLFPVQDCVHLARG